MTPIAELADIVDLVLPSSSGAPMSRRIRGRAVAGRVLELSAHLVTPRRTTDGEVPVDPIGEVGRVGRGVRLARRFWPRSVQSHRSLWSAQSMYSGLSMVSFGSFGSVLSAFSAGSILSIGSAGSVLSIGSVGSVLSIGSAGSVLGIGAAGHQRAPGDGNAPPISSVTAASVTKLVDAAATTLAAGALLSATRRH